MSGEAEQTVFITAPRRVSEAAPTGGALGVATITFSGQPMPDVFQQTGGGETITTASFAFINGDLVVRLPGYDFPIKIPAASWKDMSKDQKGAFIKLMTEFTQSPELVSFLNHLQTHGVSVVEIHFDDKIHRLDGTLDQFSEYGPDEYVDYRSVSPDETDLGSGTKVVVSIDKGIGDSSKAFSKLLIHALGHPLLGNTKADEDY